jgi:hypothetical protein
MWGESSAVTTADRRPSTRYSIAFLASWRSARVTGLSTTRGHVEIAGMCHAMSIGHVSIASRRFDVRNTAGARHAVRFLALFIADVAGAEQ